MRHLTNLLLTLILTALAFTGCGDTPESIVLDQILREMSTYESPYTGGLKHVGTIKDFGLNLDDPVAIEWNGKQLYMLADYGKFQNAAQYLFTLDRNTGVATFVKQSTKNLGGSLGQGRGFTQVHYVSPNDMTWVTPPDHYIEGIDYPIGYTGDMIAACPRLNSLVVLDLETGLASRLSWKKDFCLPTENGRPQYVAPRGIAFDGVELFIGAFSQNSSSDSELLRVSTGNFRCATPLNENPLQFGVGEITPYALCFDQQYLYMSGSDTRALYVIDRQTGLAHFVADWYFTPMPEGFRIHESGGILDIERNARGNIWITGLAHDGTDMFAVDGFTDGLYKLEKR